MITNNTIQLVCSEHGKQAFSAFGHGQLTLKCGCTWYANGHGLKFERTIPYRNRWWEQTEAERIKYEHCATNKCKRKVVATYNLDYWCAVDLKRVKQLHAAQEGK